MKLRPERYMADKKNRIKVNPFVALIVRPALKILFKYKFNFRLNLPDEVRNLKPPYLVLGNHQGFWDPFMAAVYLKPPTFYITSDAVFRSRLFKFLLGFLGAIPKTKSKSDLDALKNIFGMKEQGKNIGIFPEGQRTWDGTTLPLIKSTSKLIRMLKIPVVTVVFKGGFYSQPRWGTSIRTGEVLADYRLLLSGEEAGGMKVSELHSVLTQALTHDEIEYQKQAKIEFTGGRYAENIEQVLFACPECGGFRGFHSSGAEFSCLSCGKSWLIDSFQVIKSEQGADHFDNVRDWDRWQLQKLREMLDGGYESGEVLLEDDDVVFHTGYKSRVPLFLSKGGLRLTSEELILLNKNGDELRRLKLKGISGINVQNREVLDLYSENVLYTVRDPKKRFSSYKWWRAVEYLQREKLKLNMPE